MARHAAPPRYRRRWLSAAAILAVVVFAAVLVLVALPDSKKSPTAFTASPEATASSASPCPAHKRVAVTVVAASGIAPVVREVAGHTCLQVTVSVNDNSASAAALLKQGKADVWIPDSRVRAILAGTSLATAAPSVAVSPIVIAAGPRSDTVRFDKTPLTWAALLHQSSLSPLHVEIQNNATSSTALVLASALNGLALTETGDKYLGLASTAVASATMPGGDQKRHSRFDAAHRGSSARPKPAGHQNPRHDGRLPAAGLPVAGPSWALVTQYKPRLPSS